jgi:integrase
MSAIRKRAGKWQARVQRRGFPEQSKTFLTRDDAERWSRAIEREMDLGVYSPEPIANQQKLGELIKRYREEVTPLKRGADTEIFRLKGIEARPVANLFFTKLKASDIAKHRDDRLREVSPSTVNRELDDLSSLFNHARKEWGIRVENLVAQIRRPPRGKSRDRVLDIDEELHLMSALEGGRNAKGQFIHGTRNPWIKPLVLLALETAMRRGELLALRWNDVDLVRRTAYLELTKNGDSRVVPLSQKAIEVIKGLPKSTNGRVFPISATALRKAFERACETANILDLRFHDLRHTATTRISNKIPNLVELAAITGHKDVRMLARYYHPRAEALALKLD